MEVKLEEIEYEDIKIVDIGGIKVKGVTNLLKVKKWIVYCIVSKPNIDDGKTSHTTWTLNLEIRVIYLYILYNKRKVHVVWLLKMFNPNL